MHCSNVLKFWKARMSNWTIFSFTCCPCSLSSSRVVLPRGFIPKATVQIFCSRVALSCSTHLLLHPIIQPTVRRKASEIEIGKSESACCKMDWTEMPYSARSHYHLDEPWGKQEFVHLREKEIERIFHLID